MTRIQNGFLVVSILVLVLLCLLAVGCSRSNINNDSAKTQSEKTTFTDSCGRKVEVDKDINKVIVTGPVAQHLLMTFAPDKLVGLAVNDKNKAYIDEKYADLPVYGQIFGGKGDFNKEGVVSSGAQVIIDIGEGKADILQDADALQKQLNIPCVHIESSLSTYDNVYNMLGELLNMKDRGAQMGQYCRSKYDEVVGKLSQVNKKRGCYAIGQNGTNMIAKGSFHAGVIDLCTDNVVDTDHTSSKGTGNEVGFEQIYAWNPDVIVFGADSDIDGIKKMPEWANVSAIKNGSYYKTPSVPYNWMSSPASSNQILGLQWLGRILYPEQFNDDLKDVVKEYYKLFYNKDLTDNEFASFAS